MNEYFFDGVYVVENTLAPDTFISLHSDQYNWALVILEGQVMLTESDRGENNVQVSIQPPGLVYMRQGWHYEVVAMRQTRYLTIQGWIVASPIRSASDGTGT